MIKFTCKNCGQKISIPPKHSGKKAKCPGCKNIVEVPTLPQNSDQANDMVRLNGQKRDKTLETPIPSNGKRKESPSTPDQADAPLLTIPTPKTQPETQPPSDRDFSEEIDELLDKDQNQSPAQTGPTPKLRLPWFLDVFLYPANLNGLLQIGVLAIFYFIITLRNYGLAIVPYGFVMYILFCFIITGYLFCCLANCIADSAKGGVRAPDISGIRTLVLQELFLQILLILGCFALCFSPLALYYVITHKTDLIFLFLAAVGIFFFPMALLVGLLFETIDALNPIFLITNISRTFLSYCGLILSFYVLAALLYTIPTALEKLPYLKIISGAVALYLLFIESHVLGRFYWRNKEKLDWGD